MELWSPIEHLWGTFDLISTSFQCHLDSLSTPVSKWFKLEMVGHRGALNERIALSDTNNTYMGSNLSSYCSGLSWGYTYLKTLSGLGATGNTYMGNLNII